MPFAGGVGAFPADPNYSQQCFVTSEPLAIRKLGKPAHAHLIADAGFDPYAAVLITRRATLKKNPEQVKAVVAALHEGWNDYLDAPDATNAMMAKINPPWTRRLSMRSRRSSAGSSFARTRIARSSARWRSRFEGGRPSPSSSSSCS